MNLITFFFLENIWGSFQEEGQFIAKYNQPKDIDKTSPYSYNQIQVDLTTTFTILIGIFFPSVTGKFSSIRANRSKKSSNSIPFPI